MTAHAFRKAAGRNAAGRPARRAAAREVAALLRPEQGSERGGARRAVRRASRQKRWAARDPGRRAKTSGPAARGRGEAA